MVKNLFLPILGVIAFIIVVGIYTKNSSNINLSKFIGLASPAPAMKQIKIGSTPISVEVADTMDKRTKGLSGRSSLDQNSGMLFVFDSKNTLPVFWMKDMQFSLDMIWVSQGKVVKIDKNLPVPASGTPDGSLPTYTSNVPVDYVIEVNSGFADKNGVKVGDLTDLTSLGK